MLQQKKGGVAYNSSKEMKKESSYNLASDICYNLLREPSPKGWLLVILFVIICITSVVMITYVPLQLSGFWLSTLITYYCIKKL